MSVDSRIRVWPERCFLSEGRRFYKSECTLLRHDRCSSYQRVKLPDPFAESQFCVKELKRPTTEAD